MSREGPLMHLMFTVFFNLIFDVVMTIKYMLEKENRVKIPESPGV